MSAELLSELKQVSSKSAFSRESLKTIWEIVPQLGATLAFVLVLLWLLIDWLAGFVISHDFGWNSPYRNSVLWTIVICAFLYTLIEVARCEGVKPELRKKLKEDIAKKKTEVTEYPIKEIKVFEEPEHGGYFYFLRTSKNEVIAIIDSESQDLAIDGENPRNSSMTPKSTLRVTRAPYAKYVIKAEFQGETLDFPEPKWITSNTKIWPEDCEFVPCVWDRVEEKYAER